MGLLDKLKNHGSTLTSLDGKTPKTKEAVTPIAPNSLVDSTLDLDGKTPEKYLDNLPK